MFTRRFMQTYLRFALALLASSLLASCATEPSPSPPRSLAATDHLGGDKFTWHADSGAPLVFEGELEQVGLWLVGEALQAVDFRARRGDEWSDWEPAELTYSEGALHVGRAVLVAPADAVELRPVGDLEWAEVELYAEARVVRGAPHSSTLPREIDGRVEAGTAPGIRVIQQGLDADFVVSRSAWGARSPGLVCGSPHNPRYVTYHHTVTPTVDSISGAARVRGIQAYHMDSNGWCDVGYHFLIDREGTVYQGRSSEARTGAHAGGANTDNVGVALLGTFTTDIPPDSQFAGAARILRALSDQYSIPRDRSRVKGHREWGSTSCPGDQLYNRLGRIIEEAGGATVDPPDPDPPTGDPGATIDIAFDGISDLDSNGSSAGSADALPGDDFEVRVLLRNTGDVPLRDVEVGLQLPSQLSVSGYTIESDHPAYDRSTWSVNSADSEASNPAPGALADTGWVRMHAFSPNETKRVRIAVSVDGPTNDPVVLPEVRAWLRLASGVFETRESFDDPVETDSIGEPVRATARFDVLSTDRWVFEGPDSADLEGWAPCTEGDPGSLVATEGTLRVGDVGAEPCLASPPWTRVDADRAGALIVRLRAYDGPQPLAVRWGAEGEPVGPSRMMQVAAPGDGEWHEVEVELRRHAEWTGVVTQLQLRPKDDGMLPAADAIGRYDIDWIEFALRDGVDPDPGPDPGPDPEDPPDPAPEDPTDPAPEDPTDPGDDPSPPDTPAGDAGSPSAEDETGVERDFGAAGRGGDVTVRGCAANGHDRPLPLPTLLGFFLALAVVRRR